MAKNANVPSPPDSYPISVDRDGIDTSKTHDMPVGKHLQDHREYRDGRTMMPCEKPEWASED
jgi:hypothetical protein